MSGADESQPKDVASSVKGEGSSSEQNGSDNEQESTDNPEVTGENQPGLIPPAASGALPQGLSAQWSAGKIATDGQANQTQSITIMQSLKHQAKTVEGSAPVLGEYRDHIGAKSAVVTANGDAAGAADTAAVKAAVKAALASSVTVKNSMPLTLEGALATAHGTKNLDVASLRVEQQVADVSPVDRLLSQPTPTKYEWSMVKLDSQQQSWSRQLCNVLQDRIEMQVNQHIKQAKIRLDPPDLGRLDLTVRFDGDRLSVVVQSGNASVREALQDSLADLRGGLADQFGAGVDVNVGGDSLPKQFKESENSVALPSVEEQETIEHLPAHTSGWINALA